MRHTFDYGFPCRFVSYEPKKRGRAILTLWTKSICCFWWSLRECDLFNWLVIKSSSSTLCVHVQNFLGSRLKLNNMEIEIDT